MSGRTKSTRPAGLKTKTCSPANSKEVSKKLLECLETNCVFVLGLENPPQKQFFFFFFFWGGGVLNHMSGLFSYAPANIFRLYTEAGLYLIGRCHL